MTEILIVDDDPQLRQSLKKILEAEGYATRAAVNGEAAIDAVKGRPPDLVIMDVRMPGVNGIEALRRIQKIDPKVPVIIMTAFGTMETAIEATKLGAYDYLLKPFEISDLLELIQKALRHGRLLRSRVRMDAPPENGSDDDIVGRSRPMRELYKAIGRAAPTDATVLIRGESGTGKELAARALYQHSHRNNAGFLVINCVAIPETLLESELFGYEKGSFTGAVSRKVGKIEQANRGTVFLDEIGDMPFSIQAKILRLLQEKSIERLGGHKPIPVDVRIIAATNRNLEEAVREGGFREDLYYRLNVVTIPMPPLRERGEDIPLLADHFLERFCREMNISNPGMNRDAYEALTSRPWPGNVRELANVIQKTLIFSQGGPLSADDIRRTIGDRMMEACDSSSSGAAGDFDEVLNEWLRGRLKGSSSPALFEELMDYFAAALTREALAICDGNRTRTARLLGLSRPTLLARIAKYGVKIRASVS